MNNSQFRKLVLDTPARQASSGESKPTLGATPRRDGATPSALGSRMRSSIPMTPRSIGGVDFARQLAERNASSQPANKKFRSAAAPKGAKLPSGYVDRAKMRAETEVDDDKEERVQALEELMKEKQIDFPTFVKLRNEILSEESGNSLGKGLNFKLAEDVLGDDKEGEGEEVEDVDDEFEELAEREVKALEKEQVKKKGEMAPPSLIPGKKRNRDQILAEMKAAREAAKAAAGPSLGAKFRKVGEKRATSRIETDSKGREVLITIDENGNEKKKVRRVQVDLEAEKKHELLMPDKDAKPLGMEVPDVPAPVEEEDEDINIFDDAGDDYDPLAGLGDDDEDSDEEGEVSDAKKTETSQEKKPEPGSMAPPPRPKEPSASRNYFGDSKTEESSTYKPSEDPTLIAAINKARSINPIAKEAENAEEGAKEARRKKMLQQDDRDAQDMDIGFGSSRFEDEADFDDKKVKLSEWGGKGDDVDDDEGGKGDGKGKRKRGPKKRKGDGNNAADVMKVLERRKAAEK